MNRFTMRSTKATQKAISGDMEERRKREEGRPPHTAGEPAAGKMAPARNGDSASPAATGRSQVKAEARSSTASTCHTVLKTPAARLGEESKTSEDPPGGCAAGGGGGGEGEVDAGSALRDSSSASAGVAGPADPEVTLEKALVVTLDGIAQFQVAASDEKEQMAILEDLLKREAVTKAVVFCNVRRKVDWVTAELRARGLTVCCTHLEMEMKERKSVMREFREGASRVLVSSDLLLTRGIHVPRVPLVINYDLPPKRETYLKRVGCPGRYGQKGAAITFVVPEDMPYIEDIQQHYHTVLEDLPGDYFDTD